MERGFTEAKGRVGGWVMDVLIILQVMVSQVYQVSHRPVQICAVVCQPYPNKRGHTEEKERKICRTAHMQGECQEEKLEIRSRESSLEAVSIHSKPGPALGYGC